MSTSKKDIWIFLSHSNEDYEKVRMVRNMLEDQELRPIMFFLKCLNDDDEIDELIKREIDCRTRFILCDSENARKSKWVQREIEYIKSKNQIYEVIDLSLENDQIKEQLNSFRNRFTVNILFEEKNEDFVALLEKKLHNLDFIVNEVEKYGNDSLSGHFIIVLSGNFNSNRDFLNTINRIIRNNKTVSIFSLDLQSCDIAKKIGLKFHQLNGINTIEAVNGIFSSIQYSEMAGAFNQALTEGNPEALYWYGLRLYNDDREFDHIPNPEITCRNIECAAYFYLREAAEKGHKSAKELIRNGIWCYINPEFVESQIKAGASHPHEIHWELMPKGFLD